MTLLAGLLILVCLTAVHEAGHWLAVRLRGGRVLRLSIGRGRPVFRRQGTPEFAIGVLPLGGRIDYEGIPGGTGQAVVAVSGAVANLGLALGLFLVGALLFGVDGFAVGGGSDGPFRFAVGAVAGWFWIVPGALVDLVASQHLGGAGRALRALVGLLGRGDVSGTLYVLAAASALWASLNLIPIPFLGTDGWHAVRALAGSVLPGSRRAVQE